jgi:hypothetical protein
MRRLSILVIAVTAAGVPGTGATTAGDEAQGRIPAVRGIHWARGQALPNASPNLTYHGGPVLTTGAYVEPIFWGTKWGNAAFVADKMNGLATFYNGMGGSSYADTNTEYTDASGAFVSSAVTLGPSHVDLSAAPNKGTRPAPIFAEVCRTATTLVPDGYYPVYVDTPRGHARFCAWHSAGTCPNGVTVQFAFFFDLDGDPGCDPQDPSTVHSQGLEALANVSGHELSEALTDPHLNAWFDANGQENADKCAWSFGTPHLTFANGSQWKIQGNWSNAAFNAGTGFPNAAGQKGCIDGGNFK